MLRIATIGDNCVDIYTNLGEGFPGGGPVNFAVHARRAGAQTSYAGVIGDDEYGNWMADALQQEGVAVDSLERVPGPTALAFVRLVNGDRTFIGSDHGVRGRLRVTPELDARLAQCDLIHTTLDGKVDDQIASWHRAGRTVSYDFSHRAAPAQIDLLPYLTFAFFSGQHGDPARARAQLVDYARRGPRVVVMTLGAGGSMALEDARGCEYRQAAVPVQVVDTLGAGDAFQAGFVVEYLTSGSVVAALRAGSARAAGVCGHYGGFGHGHPVNAADPRVASMISQGVR